MLIKQTTDMTDSERIAVENSNNQYLRTLTYAPVGMIVPFGGGTLPSAFLVCDGSALDTTEYADLFNAIGYTYGGSGDTFNIPNLSGATVNGVSVKYIIKTANGITQEERLEILANVDQTYNATSENAQSGIAVAEAVSTKEDKNYLTQYLTYEVADNKACITKCNASLSGDIVIPDMLDGCPVTTIEKTAFYYCENLTSVTIPNSVTKIYACAFEACINLKSINIPSGVSNIADRTFQDCTNLKSVTISDSIISIDYSAFKNCSSLTDVYYAGSKEDMQNITINATNNESLTNATWHYNQAVATKEYVDEKAGDIDQTYDATSENAQSGVAVAKAVKFSVPRVVEGDLTNSKALIIKSLPSLTEIDGKLYPADTDYQHMIIDEIFNKESPPRNVLVTRDNNGNLYTGAPIDDEDCVNKAYVDALKAEIDELRAMIEELKG